MVKIIWLHVPEIKPYMVETQNFVKSLEKLGYNVIDGITPRNLAHAIWKPLNEHWLTDDIIIIGQDNVPTLKMIKELESCKEEACVNPCISYPASTNLPRNVQNQIVFECCSCGHTAIKPQRILEVDERPEYVDYGGTGVSKISLETQKRIKLKENPCSFPNLDGTLLKLGLNRWHTHYPMHKHKKTDMKNSHIPEHLQNKV